MLEVFFWISFFAPPLFIVALTIYVFRPSARQHYDDARHDIFNEDESLEPRQKTDSHDHSLKA